MLGVKTPIYLFEGHSSPHNPFHCHKTVFHSATQGWLESNQNCSQTPGSPRLPAPTHPMRYTCSIDSRSPPCAPVCFLGQPRLGRRCLDTKATLGFQPNASSAVRTSAASPPHSSEHPSLKSLAQRSVTSGCPWPGPTECGGAT